MSEHVTGETRLAEYRVAPAQTSVVRPRLSRSLLRSRESINVVLAVYVTVALGFLVRLIHIEMGHGFPLNDGGMFYQMILDLRHADYALPEFTSYNGGHIPFSYPPLGFYLAAAISDVGGVSSIDVLRWLPLLVSIPTMVAVFLLARSILRSNVLGVISVVGFAFIPRAYDWEITGGGLTRSLGLLFAILAIHQIYLELQSRSRVHRILAITFAALTLLSHPEMLVFLAVSVAVLFAFTEKKRASIYDLVVIAASTLAVTAPWWFTVVTRHGVAPFLQAGQTGHLGLAGWSPLLTLKFTDEELFPMWAALALAGFLYCVKQRDFLLPVWFVALFLIDPRKAATTSTVVSSMMAAIAIYSLLWPVLLSIAQRPGWRNGHETGRLSWAVYPVAVWVLAFLLFSNIATRKAQDSPLLALSTGDRSAMQWIEANLPAGSRFAVITGSDSPWIDRASEWFPALTGSTSAATVQGEEWTGRLSSRKDAFESLQECASRSEDCLRGWTSGYGLPFDYVFLSGVDASAMRRKSSGSEGCCPALNFSLRDSTDYELLFSSNGSSVFGFVGQDRAHP